MKVGGIACYGCNLLVLMEEQMALTPGNNIIDDQNSLESTAVSTSSQTPFVMGCQLVTNFVLCRMDSRSVCIVCVRAYVRYFAKGLSQYFDLLCSRLHFIITLFHLLHQILQSPHLSSSRGRDTPDQLVSPSMPLLSPITASTDDSLVDPIVSTLCNCNCVYICTVCIYHCQSVCTVLTRYITSVCIQVPFWVE